MITREQFDQIKIGQTMCAVTGPGQFPQPGMCRFTGKVIAKEETRFGRSLKVQSADGQIEWASSAHDPKTHKGIGFYLCS